MARAELKIEGFIANDLSVRIAGQHRVVDVSIPVTPQKREDDGSWTDTGPTVWYRAAFWNEHADQVLSTVQKGSLVTVTGIPKLNLYLRDGQAAGSIEFDGFPTIAAVIRRPSRNQGGNGAQRPANAFEGQSGTPGGGGGQFGAQEPEWAPAAPVGGDVWNTPAGYDETTPF